MCVDKEREEMVMSDVVWLLLTHSLLFLRSFMYSVEQLVLYLTWYVYVYP